MAMSPGSNDSTSVGTSFRRNCLFRARTRASGSSAMVMSGGTPRGAMRLSQALNPGAAAGRPRPSVTVTRNRLLSGSTVGFVRLHDLLDQRVPHHVAVVEVHERDAVDVADDLHGLG